MGCIARLGCLAVLVIATIGGWYTRDLWLPEKYRSHPAATTSAAWQPLSQDGAERTRAALDKLNQPRGQVFQTLSASDLASYAFAELSKKFPGSAENVETSVSGQTVAVRADVKLADLGGAGALGALGGMLNDREKVQLAGTFRVLRPGEAEFDVKDVRVRNFVVPRGMIPPLIRRIDRGVRPAGISETGLVVPIPRYVGDIRVANGKVTLYKTTP
jgi:hypothetical protein